MNTLAEGCKRLAEVDFPLGAVSYFSREEKKIFGSHPSMLNHWWARRPLAACRSMLLSLLLPDPCDPKCPSSFKSKAREALPRKLKEVGQSDSELRKGLIDFIGEFSSWENSDNPTYVASARRLVEAVYPDEPPLVVDSFAGGGSIPLEALRVGAAAFASDLNPVACLIERVLLEDVPKCGPKLVSEVKSICIDLRTRVEGELNDLYSKSSKHGRASGYIWARSIHCEAPNCGTEIPLLRSFWLSKKKGAEQAIRVNVDRPKDRSPEIRFELFTPSHDDRIQGGTVHQGKATCLACGATLLQDRVKAQLRASRGGSDPILTSDGHRKGGARLIAVIETSKASPGVKFRLPTTEDYSAVKRAQERLADLLSEWESRGRSGPCPVPDEHLPQPPGITERTLSAYYNFVPLRLYGFESWGDLFTARQKLVLATLARGIRDAKDYSIEARETAAFLLGRIADKNASLVTWDTGRETVRQVFTRQALPMVWDFVESSLADGGIGLLENAIDILVSVLERQGKVVRNHAQVQIADATQSPLPDASASVWFTDPPYYDAIPYSDLSDFFFVWLKRALPNHPLMRDPFDPQNLLTPKSREIIDSVELLRGVSKGGAIDMGLGVKDKSFYEHSMARAFSEGRRVLRDDGVGTIVFAHKTTEGWEALLSGIIQGGWVVTGSWPIATERPGRVRALNSATLATSVHLVCRPRSTTALVGDWGEIARELPIRVRAWMDRLSEEGIHGADLVFACIGPAMELYSKYSKVVDAEEREIPLGGDPSGSEPYQQGYLSKVWEAVGKVALEQVLGRTGESASSVEEDARLTALFLWAIQNSERPSFEPESESADQIESTEEEAGGAPSGYTLTYDVVRRFAQPLGIHLETWEGRTIETVGGNVRLLTVSERADQLFDREESETLSSIGEDASHTRQTTLPLDDVVPPSRGRGAQGKTRTPGPPDTREVGRAGPRRLTTLDRLHKSMILQSKGATGLLRQTIYEEKRRGPEFERLARSLTALYPVGSEERRLLEALDLVR